nr:MAG TPA: hypothetical protein [Caudoviricetes sp.]
MIFSISWKTGVAKEFYSNSFVLFCQDLFYIYSVL